jgi:hypothetical protein
MIMRRQGLILLLLLAACDQQPTEVKAPAARPAAVERAAPPQPVPEPPAPKTCADERGADAARILANRCRIVSGATHPPCHPDNSCAMIQGEIDRNCANMSDVEECAGPTEATSQGTIYESPLSDR